MCFVVVVYHEGHEEHEVYKRKPFLPSFNFSYLHVLHALHGRLSFDNTRFDSSLNSTSLRALHVLHGELSFDNTRLLSYNIPDKGPLQKSK